MAENVWAWVGLSWTDRIRLVLDQYGDRLTDISIFGWRVTIDGTLYPTFDPVLLQYYREKWPHIRWWGCFRNMDDPQNGPRTIFDALRDSPSARAHLADEVQAKMFETHPWLYGVDIDMESGGDLRFAESEEIFRVVTDRAHALGKKASGALPGLTATGSVGGENWVRYKQLGEILDHVSIMSYDFAWNGSAPGPISPTFWLEDVYNWASTQIKPSKLSMGLPLYGRFWQIYDYPSALGDLYRGQSGTYYSCYQYFTGNRGWSDQHDPIGWVVYRDPGSQSAWGYLNVYDWFEPNEWDSASGVVAGVFQDRSYAVRYGLPGGNPQWTIADNSVRDSEINYSMVPEPVWAADGRSVSPKVGYTLTTEYIQRDPVAATIVDDYATSQAQLNAIYTKPSGNWTYHEVYPGYRQYRGSGDLRFNHDFGSQALYIQARFQYAQAGRMGVYAKGISAEVTNDGVLQIKQGNTVLGSKNVASRPVGQAAQAGRAVIALRVREGTARAYYSLAETSIPLQLEVNVTPPGGPVGVTATGSVWIDHLYLGDGWWYQPREAMEITVGGETRLVGRIPRTGVTWNAQNMFRPDADVEEPTTRTATVSPDWAYEHWKDVKVTTGALETVKIRPIDHDLWIGRVCLLDRDGASIVYFSDSVTIAHWRDRAHFDWGLQGIAMWSLGQEDVRMWDRFKGGELPAHTKRLND